MNNNKLLQMLSMVGETIVLIGAMMWSWVPEWAVYVFVTGSCMFFAGRMLSTTPTDDITIKRLLAQQKTGVLILLFSAITMIATPTWFFGYYITKSAWFIPFLIFVIIEVYTTFRLIYLDNKRQK